MAEIDIQWPEPFQAPGAMLAEDPEKRIALRDSLEEQLTRHWGRPAMLLTSARAAITHILRLLAINRSHVLYTPKWVSHCLWDAFGRYGNATCSPGDAVDICLAVHKYGRPVRGKVPADSVLIEDACDALIVPGGNPFPNEGRFAVLSLPKMAGMWCGGVLLSRDFADHQALREARDAAPFDSLAIRQGVRRWQAAAGLAEEGASWTFEEYRSIHLDLTALDHLSRHLFDSLRRSAPIIEARLAAMAAVSSLAPHVERWREPGWLPPVIPVPADAPVALLLPHLPIKHVALGTELRPAHFVKCRILPVHAGYADEDFGSIVKLCRPVQAAPAC